MKLDASTLVEPRIYNRVIHIQYAVKSALRDEIQKKAFSLGWYPIWDTERIDKVLFDKHTCRCEDRLMVTMTVDVSIND